MNFFNSAKIRYSVIKGIKDHYTLSGGYYGNYDTGYEGNYSSVNNTSNGPDWWGKSPPVCRTYN